MNPEHKKLAEQVIDSFKKSEKSKLIPAKDISHLLQDRNISEKIIYSLEKDFGLIERCGKCAFRLNDKGWKFTTFDQLEKDSNKTPLTLYNKIHIGLTIISLALVFIFGCLNYSLNQDKTDLNNQNNVLISDLARCTDSLSLYKEKALLKMLKTSSDKEQSNSYLDVKID